MIKQYAYIALCFGIFACSNDDRKELNVTREDLMGKWYFETEYVQWNGTGTTNGPVDYSGNQPGCEKDFIVHANAGSFSRDYVNPDCDFEDNAFTWNVNGDRLQMTIDGTPVSEFKIESFDGDTFEISSEFDTGFLVEKRTLAFLKAE